MVDFHKCFIPHISTVVLVVVIENVMLQYISTLDIIGLSHVFSLKTFKKIPQVPCYTSGEFKMAEKAIVLPCLGRH